MVKKLLINRRPVIGPWGGGNNFIKALHELSPRYGFEPVNSFNDDIDIIFMVDPRYDELGISIKEIAAYKKWRPQTKVVYRVNECDSRKGLVNDIDPLIKASSHIIDAAFFISQWIKDYHVDESWACKKNHVIYSGTNKEFFTSREKLSNGKTNIVTHHWSDNRLKGQDFYEMLDSWVKENDEYTFTYIGRTNAQLKNSNIIQPTFGEQLGKLLSRYDIYVSASRNDPGPNHIIESLACGIPTYAHVDSGGAREMVGPDHLFSNFDELIGLISSPTQNNFVPATWEECIDRYFEVIIQLFK